MAIVGAARSRAIPLFAGQCAQAVRGPRLLDHDRDVRLALSDHYATRAQFIHSDTHAPLGREPRRRIETSRNFFRCGVCRHAKGRRPDGLGRSPSYTRPQAVPDGPPRVPQEPLPRSKCQSGRRPTVSVSRQSLLFLRSFGLMGNPFIHWMCGVSPRAAEVAKVRLWYPRGRLQLFLALVLLHDHPSLG
jgi:hypothetical protein